MEGVLENTRERKLEEERSSLGAPGEVLGVERSSYGSPTGKSGKERSSYGNPTGKSRNREELLVEG